MTLSLFQRQQTARTTLRYGAVFGLAIAGLMSLGQRAEAQAAYGSYVGVGASVGLTSGDSELGEDQDFSGVIAARYHFLKLPISLRAQALVFTDTDAFVPTVSYDFPINWQTDAYIGAGVAFQDDSDSASPIGNETAFVVQPGVDYSIPNSRFVVFGNAIIAFDAYEQGGGTAAALQGGVGLQF